ncbi:MAG: hypothetical protein ACK4MS_03435 [Paracoccaceae bacterium]
MQTSIDWQAADTAFLGHAFRPLVMADKVMLQDYLRRYPQHVSGYIFATPASYAPIYGILWSQVGPGLPAVGTQAGR